MMPVGALLGGFVVSQSEMELGRELALRMPYAVAGCIAVIVAIYGLFRLRL